MKQNPDKTVSLLNFNTFGTPLLAPLLKQRYIALAEILNNSSIDILCLQEVQTYHHLNILKKRLTSYPHVLYDRFAYGPKGGLVTFSRLPFKDVRYRSFANLGKFTNFSIYSHIVRNGVLWGTLQDIPLSILNTHLITDYEFNWSPQNKYYALVQAQVMEAAAIFNSIAQQKNAVIMTGDFNFAKGSPLYQSFLTETKTTDLFQSFSFPTYNPSRLPYHFKGKKADRIDFMFINNAHYKISSQVAHMLDKKVALQNGKTTYLSDHIALQSKLSLVL